MKPQPGRPSLPTPALIVLAGADAAQVAALMTALTAALQQAPPTHAPERAQDAGGLPPFRLRALPHLPPGAPLPPDAAAHLAGARQALLVCSPAGPAQAAQEQRLRETLAGLNIPYAIVPPPPHGLERALSALRASLRQPTAGPRWRWICPDCDDGECESHAIEATGLKVHAAAQPTSEPTSELTTQLTTRPPARGIPHARTGSPPTSAEAAQAHPAMAGASAGVDPAHGADRADPADGAPADMAGEPPAHPADAGRPFTILHRDEDWLAIHKPAGWLVHRTGLDAHEPRIVLQALRDQIGQPVYPVHRLDKGTSGVLVLALTPDAARTWADRFAGRVLAKRYLALVRGWPPAAFTVNHALRPDDAPRDTPAQEAVTVFTRLARLQIDEPLGGWPSVRAALVEARPLTGRRHQIRRHLKHAAHPVIGDATHGKGAINRWWARHLGLQRLWLHAWSLQPQEDPGTDADSGLPAVCSPLQAAFNADWHAVLALPQWHWDEGGQRVLR